MTTAEDIRQARAVVRLMHIRLRVADDETREALIEQLEELSEAGFGALEAAVNYKTAAEDTIHALRCELRAQRNHLADPALSAVVDIFSRKAPPEVVA